MSRLTKLRITDAPRITGTVPQEWVSTLQLQHLELTNLSLSGPMPPLTSKLANVTLRHMPGLILPDMGLTGLVPNASLSLLALTNISGWAGTGLPPFLSTVHPNIIRLELVALGLVGTIPTTWQSFNVSQLRDLQLSSNMLTGTLPAWLASRIARGRMLDLAHNNFTGAEWDSMPADLGVADSFCC
jgi:hypothetical protein